MLCFMLQMVYTSLFILVITPWFINPLNFKEHTFFILEIMLAELYVE